MLAISAFIFSAFLLKWDRIQIVSASILKITNLYKAYKVSRFGQSSFKIAVDNVTFNFSNAITSLVGNSVFMFI